jgi:hypothetical protein
MQMKRTRLDGSNLMREFRQGHDMLLDPGETGSADCLSARVHCGTKAHARVLDFPQRSQEPPRLSTSFGRKEVSSYRSGPKR